MQKLQIDQLPVQHLSDIRQELCLAREYLLRRPKKPLPAPLHQLVVLGAPGGQAAPQGAGPHLSAGSHPYIQALAGAVTLHLPLLSVAVVVAAILPVLQSPCLTHQVAYQDWVVEHTLSTLHPERRPPPDVSPPGAAGECGDPCWKCRRINFGAVFGAMAEVPPLTLPYSGVSTLASSSDAPLCGLCRFLGEIAKELSLDPVPDTDYGPGDWTLDVRKDELVLYHGATRRGQLRRASSTATCPPRHQRLNVEQVRQWLTTCEKEHSGLCGTHWPGQRTQKPIRLTLIDVREGKLIESTSTERYVALSYVWGSTTTLLSQISNFQTLRRDGTLSQANEAIARAIRDAMSLVDDMGERYLWADTLCIVQDDPVGKMEAIESMAACNTPCRSSPACSGTACTWAPAAPL
jgi:hypothetical protein